MNVDSELLNLFAGEASEALDRLSGEALALEQPGDQGERVATMFRAAHSLKGSARLVGLGDLGDVAHALEDVLSDLRDGTLAPSSDLVSLILRGSDIIRELLTGALSGDDQHAASAAAVQEIAAAGRALHGTADVAEPTPSAGAATAGSALAAGDTVRVSAERIDAIGRLVGEALAAQVGLERVIGADSDGRLEAPLHQLGRVLEALDTEAQRARMVSFATVAAPLQRAARDVAQSAGKAVEWQIEGGETQLDRQVLERLRDPLLHLVRNAVDHGLETPAQREAAGKAPSGTLSVQASTQGDEVVVVVSDDGRGVDRDAVAGAAGRLGLDSDPDAAIFDAGVSTAATVTDVSGRGVGLDVVRDTVARMRGHVSVSSAAGEGATFEVRVPLTVASLRCLIVRVGDERYALGLDACACILDDIDDRRRTIEGRPVLELDGDLLALHDIGALLGVAGGPAQGQVIALRGGGRRHALRVDGVEGQRDVLVKDLPRAACAIPAISGASVEPDGTVMLVLDSSGLVELIAGPSTPGRRTATAATASQPGADRRREVLVVDDALTVRELQRSILARNGYAVRTAVDGNDAISQLGTTRPDIVISDVEMPGMDGIELTASIRAHPNLSQLPVILVTSLRDEKHRRRGLEVGADAYLAKDTFDELALLAAIDRALVSTR